MPDKRLSPASVARLLGKSRQSVMELIHAGEIEATDESQPGSRIPRYRIDVSALDRWRANRRVKPETMLPGKKPRTVEVAGVLARRREARRRKRAMEAVHA